MRRLASRFPIAAIFTTLAILAVLVLPMAPAAQDQSPFPEMGGRGRPIGRYQVSGTLRSEADNRGVENVRVDLHTMTGATFATAFTNNNGEFSFNDVRAGNYSLEVQPLDFESVSQQVEVDSPVLGLDIWLHPRGVKPTSKNGTVSARELSIPQKAHDDMQKGLTLLYQKSDSRGSLPLFERAVKEYPDYYEAYAQMGMAYMNLKDSVDSEQALRKSIEISKERYADAYNILALLCSSDARYTDAAEAARKAVEIDPNSWQADFELADALFELKQFPEAEKSAAAAVELKPDSLQSRLLLADIHSRLGQFPAALDDLKAYLKLGPQGETADRARKIRDQLQQELANPPDGDVADTADSSEPADPAKPPAVSPVPAQPPVH
jgi:cytochrome c-type biogenesis protein CcmH/NrfG